MIPESPNNQSPVSAPPQGVSASDAGDSDRAGMPPANTADPLRTLTGYGLALLVCLTVVSALRWWWYPNSVDRYYHLSVIQAMQETGGLPSWDFWGMNPGQRAHIYPMAFHVLGYFLSFVGVSPATFITILSWVLYPASLFTTWLWLRKVSGPRSALIALMLLAGSAAVFWNQTTFNAIAFGMALAPLALLALESERFLACAVLNLLAATAHPICLFLPLALAFNTLLCRKKLLAGLLAAGLPMLFYGPWLAQLLTSLGCLVGRWNDNDLIFIGYSVGSRINIGLLPSLAAALGFFYLLIRRREALGLLGPALGFVLVIPMGLGKHFLLYNFHWLLACLGGYGIGVLLEWLERKWPDRLPAMKFVLPPLVLLVLTTWVAVEIQVPNNFVAPSQASSGSSGSVVLFKRTRAREANLRPNSVPEVDKSSARLTLGMSVLTQLLDPNGWITPVGGDAGPPEKTDMPQKKGASEFLEAIKKAVAADEIIYTSDGPVARFLTGDTGRWTTGGVLRDARAPDFRFRPEDCHFVVTINGRPMESPKLNRSFTKVFGNPFGTLYKNAASPPKREPVKAVISTLGLIVLTGLGIGLVVFDLWLPRERN